MSSLRLIAARFQTAAGDAEQRHRRVISRVRCDLPALAVAVHHRQLLSSRAVSHTQCEKPEELEAGAVSAGELGDAGGGWQRDQTAVAQPRALLALPCAISLSQIVSHSVCD